MLSGAYDSLNPRARFVLYFDFGDDALPDGSVSVALGYRRHLAHFEAAGRTEINEGWA